MNVQEIFFENMNYLLKYANILSSDSIFSQGSKPLSNKIAVGVSGGADSLSLAILAARYAEYYGFEISTYTVNHNLREGALKEALYVNFLMQQFGIPHKILHWEHGDIKFGHIESDARNARYNLLRNAIIEDNCDILLTAHTENDLAETFILRKVKKSKQFGLAGISALRDFGCGKFLLRPFLNIKKTDLMEFLNTLNVDWVHDPSNDDEKYQRVKVRQALLRRPKFHDLIIKRVKRLAFLRQEIEFDMLTFMKENVFFDRKLLSIDILKKTFYEYRYRVELIQNLIMIIGGSAYPVSLDNCLNKLYKFQKFTLGRCVIDFSENYFHIYRENKGDVPLEKGNGYFFDNRLFVKFIHENAFIAKAIGKKNLFAMYKKKLLGNLKNLDQKSSLPAVFASDNEVLFVPGITYRKDDIEWAEIEFGRRFIPFISIYH